MLTKIPILLSFYAFSNGHDLVVFGQLTYSRIHDMSFRDYSLRKTFRTLIALYQTRPYANQDIELLFDESLIKVKTDGSGAFFIKAKADGRQKRLQKIKMSSNMEVKTLIGLYSFEIHYINASVIVVSDIDDTLLDSFIVNKFQKFRTLMFTTVEKRKAVVSMQQVMNSLLSYGAVPFYLSNSEQNLYPLIYRFLLHNNFPSGPLFLKRLRKFWDVFKNVKTPDRDIHKVNTLKEILTLFSDKTFVLIGDNTQRDLLIYTDAAERFPGTVKYIIIRKVIEKPGDEALIEETRTKLLKVKTTLYYADRFPTNFEW